LLTRILQGSVVTQTVLGGLTYTCVRWANLYTFLLKISYSAYVPKIMKTV